jgi:hypothetical protein
LAKECHARVVGYAGKKLREKGPSEGDQELGTGGGSPNCNDCNDQTVACCVAVNGSLGKNSDCNQYSSSACNANPFGSAAEQANGESCGIAFDYGQQLKLPACAR